MKKQTILVVDDSATVLALVRSMLKNEGYHVLSAGNGEEALRIDRESGDMRTLYAETFAAPYAGSS